MGFARSPEPSLERVSKVFAVPGSFTTMRVRRPEAFKRIDAWLGNFVTADGMAAERAGAIRGEVFTMLCRED